MRDRQLFVLGMDQASDGGMHVRMTLAVQVHAHILRVQVTLLAPLLQLLQ